MTEDGNQESGQDLNLIRGILIVLGVAASVASLAGLAWAANELTRVGNTPTPVPALHGSGLLGLPGIASAESINSLANIVQANIPVVVAAISSALIL